MLFDANETNISHLVQQDMHSLYRLSIKPSAQIAIATKPVFGANITLYSGLIEYASCFINPNNTVGWVDHRGLSNVTVEQQTRVQESDNNKVLLPSQFFKSEGGVMRVTAPTRIYIIGRSCADMHKHGLFLFSLT